MREIYPKLPIKTQHWDVVLDFVLVHWSGASVFGFQQRNVGLDNDHHFRIIYRSLESYSLQDIRSCKKKHENSCKRQKHPSGSDFIKRCSENMLQIYRRTHMQFVEIALQHGCSPVNFLYIFRAPFPNKSSEGRLLKRW